MLTDSKRPLVQRVAVVTAIVVTLLLAMGSFVLSFSALWDLASEIWPQRHLSWIAPVLIDGTILSATISLFAAADDQDRHRRTYFWFLLMLSAVISMGGNALHAYAADTDTLSPAIAVIGGTLPPAFLLLSTHGLVLLLRRRNEVATASKPWAPDSAAATNDGPNSHDLAIDGEGEQDALAQPDANVERLATADHDEARIESFMEPARRLRELSKANTDTATIAHILWLDHCHPGLTTRMLAKSANVHHNTVGRILTAWTEHREAIERALDETLMSV